MSRLFGRKDTRSAKEQLEDLKDWATGKPGRHGGGTGYPEPKNPPAPPDDDRSPDIEVDVKVRR